MEIIYSIKDRLSVSSYGMWSGSDYNINLSGIVSGFELTQSRNHSSNGDYSIEVTNTVTGYNYMWLSENHDTIIGEVYTGIINILNNSSTQVSLRLLEIETNKFNDITIPPNESMQKIMITRTIQSTSKLKFYLIIREPTTVYIDNITLKHQ